MRAWAANLRRDNEPYLASEANEALDQYLPVFLTFQIDQTDLLAPTNCQLISPVAGRIVGLGIVVQAAVTTGGAITVLRGTTTVTGLGVTLVDADAAGVLYTDSIADADIDSTMIVAAGGRIQIAPAAAIATAGAVNGYLKIIPA